MKTLLACTALVSVLVAAGCSTRPSAAADTHRPAAVVVSTQKPERRDLTNRLQLTGTIVPYEQVTLYAKASGYLRSITVDMGDHVRAGQTIAVLDIPEMEAGLGERRASTLQAEAAVEQARASVEQQKAELRLAQLSYQRLAQIRSRTPDVVSEQEVDQARASFDVAAGKLKSAEAQVRVAESNLAAAQSSLAAFQAMLTYSRISAPISGVVTRRFVDPGDLIQSASASRTQAAPVVSVARVDRLRIVADIPEASALRVKAGTAARVTVDALPGEVFAAPVARISQSLDAATRTMRAEVELPNPGERLRPGMAAGVSFDLASLPAALTIPVTALRWAGADRYVFVVSGSSVKRVNVKTGLESAQWIQVIEGLRGDEDLVVAAAGFLEEGTPVNRK